MKIQNRVLSVILAAAMIITALPFASLAADAVNCLKENHLPYAYWEYCAGFGAYDLNTKQWKPYVTDALLQ